MLVVCKELLADKEGWDCIDSPFRSGGGVLQGRSGPNDGFQDPQNRTFAHFTMRTDLCDSKLDETEEFRPQ